MSGKDLAKEEEGLRLRAYPDPGTGGVPWTIGYGHTRGVRQGDVITLEQAEAFFEEDWDEAQAVVKKFVTVPLSTQQLDALTSFVFNVGPGRKNVKDGFVQLKNGNQSTMLRKLNAGDYIGAAAQFDLWVNAEGKKMKGLVKRRKKEKALFLSGTNLPDQPFVKDEPMAPIASTILMNAIPALFNKLPEIASIFKNPNVSERNIEAVSRVGQIIIESTGSTNIQQAVERIEESPEAAQAANEALRMNRAELTDMMERINKMHQGNIAAARAHNVEEGFMIDTPWFKAKFIHLLSLFFIGFSGAFAWANWVDLTPELKGAIITLMIIAGWNGVRDYWMGSSSGSDKKTDLMRDDQRL